MENSETPFFLSLSQLFSVIIDYENQMNDIRSLLAQNQNFYPEEAFLFLCSFSKKTTPFEQNPEIIDIFAFQTQPSNLPNNLIVANHISDSKLNDFLEYNDIFEFSMNDLKTMRNFYLFSRMKEGLDKESFFNFVLPRKSFEERKKCRNRNKLYQESYVPNLNPSIQTLLTSLFEEELLLEKISESIKVKLAQETEWDVLKIFELFDDKSKGYLNLDDFIRFMKFTTNKFCLSDWRALTSRIGKFNVESIAFDDFKKLIVCNETYNKNITFIDQNQSQRNSELERIDQAFNDEKYSILRSTVKSPQSKISENNSKIRWANVDGETRPPSVFSSNSKASQVARKSYDNSANHKFYSSYSDGKNLVMSHVPSSKIIRDLYGEHTFVTTNNEPTISTFTPQKEKQDEKIVPRSNFHSYNKDSVSINNLFSPMRQNNQLLDILNKEIQTSNLSQSNNNLSSSLSGSNLFKSSLARTNILKSELEMNRTKKIFDKEIRKPLEKINDIEIRRERSSDRNGVRNEEKLQNSGGIKNNIGERSSRVNKPTPKIIF